ncbi:MAG: hypothetical protein WAS33_02865 [Candidatus Promineifilaceae bacterium]|nr:hypothetical protein [Anaerolineaceae bacterium]
MDGEIELDNFGGYAPIQAKGKVGKLNFYFRARWDTWRFEIGKLGVEVPALKDDELLFTREGDFLSGDSHEEMATVIVNCFKEYFAETQNPNAAKLLSDLTEKLRAIKI